MPLTALLEDRLVVLPTMDPAAIANLASLPNRARLRLRCCGEPALLDADQAFRHAAGSRCPADRARSEHPAHLELRRALARGAAAAGWDVDPDQGHAVDGHGVLAQHRNITALFAVPAYPLDEAAMRGATALYKASGITRVLWLTAKPPASLVTSRDVPCFAICQPDRSIAVGGQRLTADDFAYRGMRGDIRWAAQAFVGPLQSCSLLAGPGSCAACGTRVTTVWPMGEWRSSCGVALGPIRLEAIPAKDLGLLEAVAASDPAGRLEFRVGHGWANVCRCGRNVEPRYQRDLYSSDLGKRTFQTESGMVPTALQVGTGHPHWCLGSPSCSRR